MDMSAASNLLARRKRAKPRLAVRIKDLPVLLAVLATRQADCLTAKRVREGDPPDLTGDEPGRMAEIFAPVAARPVLPKGAAGAFNTGIAARLTMGDDGENGVYSGT
jgi:hypothetical protein